MKSMRRVKCEGCGLKVLERALTRATWIESTAPSGAPRWCADCVLSDPPPREIIRDLSPSAEPEPGRL